MKSLLFILASTFVIVNSCSTFNGDSVGGNFELQKDTIKIAHIDSMVYKINRQWKLGPELHTIPLNDRDTVQYLELNGEPQRISSIFLTDTLLTWVVFHQVNNERKLVRFRQRRNLPVPTTKEVLAYYDKGKMFFTAERGKQIEEGEGNGAFRHLPFIENSRTPAEVEAEFEPYWQISKKAIDAERSSTKQ
jgi:hypothetical protein